MKENAEELVTEIKIKHNKQRNESKEKAIKFLKELLIADGYQLES